MSKASVFTKYVEDYLNENRNGYIKIADSELLKELQEYDILKWISNRARDIYYQLLDSKHIAIAEKVKQKYTVPERSDRLIAFEQSLLAQQILNSKK